MLFFYVFRWHNFSAASKLSDQSNLTPSPPEIFPFPKCVFESVWNFTHYFFGSPQKFNGFFKKFKGSGTPPPHSPPERNLYFVILSYDDFFIYIGFKSVMSILDRHLNKEDHRQNIQGIKIVIFSCTKTCKCSRHKNNCTIAWNFESFEWAAVRKLLYGLP